MDGYFLFLGVFILRFQVCGLSINVDLKIAMWTFLSRNLDWESSFCQEILTKSERLGLFLSINLDKNAFSTKKS
jgi:hypothetical protein